MLHMTGYQRVLDALEEQDLLVPSWSDTVAALCPAHDDTNASLSLREGDEGKALLYCHAGCDVAAVADALGLRMQDLFSDEGVLGDEDGVGVDVYDETSVGGGAIRGRGHYNPSAEKEQNGLRKNVPGNERQGRNREVSSGSKVWNGETGERGNVSVAGGLFRVRPGIGSNDVAISGSAQKGQDSGGTNSSESVPSVSLRTSKNEESRKITHEYVYTDEQGEPLIRVNRTEPKGFFQERWEDGQWKTGLNGARRTLFNLPKLAPAIANNVTVYVVEGEKDALALEANGAVATTSIGGASAKWLPEWTVALTGAQVVIVPDQDDPGLAHARKVATALAPVAASVRIRFVSAGKDISDHFAAGLTLGDLRDEDFLEELSAVDWDTYEVAEEEWLWKPYIPRAGRVLLYGKTGSLKSLFAMWLAARLAREGRRVAYFSVEMRPSQAVDRMRKLNPPKSNFVLFTKLQLENPDHIRLAAEGLKGYDLVVVDSWNATIKQSSYDQDIADLDNDVFQPLIDATGATILLIDNTGHDVFTDKGKFKMDRARGSSAKADKMDVTLWMDRPFEDDNYQSELHVKKMRYDFPIPSPVRISTPQDSIEFYITDNQGHRTGPLWGGVWNVTESTAIESSGVGASEPEEPVSVDSAPVPAPEDSTYEEMMALARLKDKFKMKEVEDVPVSWTEEPTET